MLELFLVGLLFVMFGGTWLVCHKIGEWLDGR